MKSAIGVLLVMMAAGTCFGQTAPAPVYVESFRRGTTRIRERTEEVNLSVREPLFETIIKDAAGNNRFRFSIAPARIGVEDPSILAWQASLVDMRHRAYGNLLLPSRDNVLNQGPKGNAFRLDPNTYAVVPVRAKRVIKVENFYCVLQVEDFRLIVPERWHLDAMEVGVKLTNTNPLSGPNQQP